MDANNRIQWVDVAKGIGIITVIISHMGAGALEVWINSFHMPLFFFLSGYVFSAKRDFPTFLKKKAKGLLVPYFALGIFDLIFQIFYTKNHYHAGHRYTKEFIMGFLIQIRYLTLWFLATLFFMSLFFYVIIRLCKKDWQIALIVILMAVAGHTYYHFGGPDLPWNVDAAFTMIPFMAAGFLFKKYREPIVRKCRLNTTKGQILWFAVMFVCNVVLSAYNAIANGKRIDFFWDEYNYVLLTYPVAFMGIAAICIASCWIRFKPLRYLGENTMLYFLWHQTIMIPLAEMLLMSLFHWEVKKWTPIWNVVLYRTAEFAIIMLALTIINIPLCKSKLKVLLGK